MDPSVMFIFGSVVVGLALIKTGRTRRLACKMLAAVGERTNMLLLGCMVVTTGMPFLLLIGAAPNAIAYESKQFTTGESFRHGITMSIALLIILGIAIVTRWQMLGMPILVN